MIDQERIQRILRPVLIGFDETQRDSLERALEAIVVEVSTASKTDAEPRVRIDSIIQANTRSYLRLKPAPAGQALQLPAPRKCQAGDWVEVSIEAPEGALRVVALPHDEGRVRVTSTVNGLEFATFLVSGFVRFVTNGDDRWSSTTEFPAESPNAILIASTGAVGETGATGATGIQGGPGTQGQRGYTGERGYPGPVGASGSGGTPGAPGARGWVGDRGYPGAPGQPGAVGTQGPPGLAGRPALPALMIPGITGAAGLQGFPGMPGARGYPGDRGYPGQKGDKGDKGDQGPPGGAGRPGASGGPGPAGSNGSAGATGATGTSALFGEVENLSTGSIATVPRAADARIIMFSGAAPVVEGITVGASRGDMLVTHPQATVCDFIDNSASAGATLERLAIRQDKSLRCIDDDYALWVYTNVTAGVTNQPRWVCVSHHPPFANCTDDVHGRQIQHNGTDWVAQNFSQYGTSAGLPGAGDIRKGTAATLEVNGAAGVNVTSGVAGSFAATTGNLTLSSAAAGSRVIVSGADDVLIEAVTDDVFINSGDLVQVAATGLFRVRTATVDRLVITAAGAFQVNGNAGAAGQVFLSGGASATPVWGAAIIDTAVSLSATAGDVDIGASADVDISASGDIQMFATGETQVLGSGILRVGAGATDGFIQLEASTASTPTVAGGDFMLWSEDPAVGPTLAKYTDDNNTDWTLGWACPNAPITANVAATNATTNLSCCTYTIPAASGRVATSYRYTGWYVFNHGNAGAAPTLTAELLVNGAVVSTSILVPTATILIHTGKVEVILTIRSAGAGGTMMIQQQNVSSAWAVGANGGSNDTATDAIDTTVARTTELRIRMTTAVASNTLTVTNGYVEKLY